MAIMGASGSGKSTMLHLLGGLDLPTSGEVVIDGISISSLDEEHRTLTRRAKTGFVFQFFNLIPLLNVAENVALPFLIAGDPVGRHRDRIDELLRLVGLNDKAEHRPDQLSAGEQQRVALARALATAPAILLADEPTGNLDYTTGTEILDLLWDSADRLGPDDRAGDPRCARGRLRRPGARRAGRRDSRRDRSRATGRPRRDAADPSAIRAGTLGPMRLGTLAWRGLLARRLRTALALAGIALGVAAVTSTIVAGSASEQALESATTALLGKADVRLRAFADEGFGPRTVQAIRSQPGVVAAARRLGAPPHRLDRARRRRARLHAPRARDRPGDRLRDPASQPDRGHPALDELADRRARAGIMGGTQRASVVGDTLLISGRREGVPGLRIVGLMDDTGLGALEGGDVIVIARSTLDTALAVPSPIRYVDLDLGDAPSAEQIDAVEATLTEPFVAETPADVAERFASAQEGFVGVALLFGAVALVVGAFLVGNALAMTVGERARELGLLRAAGTTSRQVLGIVVRQALALGLIGSALGVVAGIALAAAMIGFLSTTRAVLVVGLPLPVGGLLAAFLLGLLITMLGAVLPAMRAARLSPLDALRPPRRGERGLSDRLRPLVLAELLVVLAGLALAAFLGVSAAIVPIALSLALLVGGAVAAAYVLEPLGRIIGRPFEWFFGAQGLLGRANLSRDRARTGLTVGAMMIGLAAVVALGTVAESARAATDRRVASILPGGHAIRSGVPLDIDAFRASFEATPGLAIASPVLELPVVRVTAEGQEEAALAGIDPNVFADHDGLIISGASREDAFAALRDGGAVLVPEALADRADIVVGQTLSLGAPGGQARDLRVAGIVALLPAGADGRRGPPRQQRRRARGVRRHDRLAVDHGPECGCRLHRLRRRGARDRRSARRGAAHGARPCA